MYLLIYKFVELENEFVLKDDKLIIHRERISLRLRRRNYDYLNLPLKY